MCPFFWFLGARVGLTIDIQLIFDSMMMAPRKQKMASRELVLCPCYTPGAHAHRGKWHITAQTGASGRPLLQGSLYISLTVPEAHWMQLWASQTGPCAQGAPIVFPEFSRDPRGKENCSKSQGPLDPEAAHLRLLPLFLLKDSFPSALRNRKANYSIRSPKGHCLPNHFPLTSYSIEIISSASNIEKVIKTHVY